MSLHSKFSETADSNSWTCASVTTSSPGLTSGSSSSVFPITGNMSTSPLLCLMKVSTSSSVPHPSGSPQGRPSSTCSLNPSLDSLSLLMRDSLKSVASGLTSFSEFFLSCLDFCMSRFFNSPSVSRLRSQFSFESEPNVFAISDARLLISLAASWVSLLSSVTCRLEAIMAFKSSWERTLFGVGLVSTIGKSSFFSASFLFISASLANSSPSSKLPVGDFGFSVFALGAKNLSLMSFTFGITISSSPTGSLLKSAPPLPSVYFFLMSCSLGTYSRLASAVLHLTGSSDEGDIRLFFMSDTLWELKQSASEYMYPSFPESKDIERRPRAFGSDVPFWPSSLKDDNDVREDEIKGGVIIPSLLAPPNFLRDCSKAHSCSLS